MGQFGLAAILAALCSSLCLYGSRGGDLKYAARIKLEVTAGLGNMFTVELMACMWVPRLSQYDRIVAQHQRSKWSDSRFVEYNNCQVKPIYKELSMLVFVILLIASWTRGVSRSRFARPSIPRLSVRPFPYTACMTAGFAAEMCSGGTTATLGNS